MSPARPFFLFSFFFLLVTPAAGGPLDAWQAEKVPRLRIAASPYPNSLLHVLPTGADFGDHLYRVKIDTLGMGPSSETSRGHFYTRHGGFLDLAHIRRTMDFTAYLHYHLRAALTAGKNHFSFTSIDKTTYHCHLHYPPFWSTIRGQRKVDLIDELALEAAAQAAFDFSNWREILTWYDFHNVPGMPEKGSAFSYEDVPSHAVGIAVAVRALRRPGVPFDEAATLELDRELHELVIVPEETYQRAMALVENKWWGKKTCLKRFTDTGRDDGSIVPWLVKGLEPEISVTPKIYPAPRRDFSKVRGFNCERMIVFECEPHLPKKDRVLRHLAPDTTRVRTDTDYPLLLERIEEEIRNELGPRATKP
jgi:hypothetical protein